MLASEQSKLWLFGASLLGRRCRDWTSRSFNRMPLLYIISECDSVEIICAQQTTMRQNNYFSSEWIEWHFCPVCLYQRYLDSRLQHWWRCAQQAIVTQPSIWRAQALWERGQEPVTGGEIWQHSELDRELKPIIPLVQTTSESPSLVRWWQGLTLRCACACW